MPDRTPQPPPRLSPAPPEAGASADCLRHFRQPAVRPQTSRLRLAHGTGSAFRLFHLRTAGDPASLVTVPLPYPLRPSWSPDTELASITCHRFIAVPLTRIFQRTLEHYGMERIRELRLDVYGGCFNNRPIRGGSRPSLHAWGHCDRHGPPNAIPCT